VRSNAIEVRVFDTRAAVTTFQHTVAGIISFWSQPWTGLRGFAM